jgi:hypothetical protein
MIEDAKRFPAIERYPTTLVEQDLSFEREGAGEYDEERARVQNIARAIRNMAQSLQKFVWIQPWACGPWQQDLGSYNLVCDALRASPSLKELKIADRSSL